MVQAYVRPAAQTARWALRAYRGSALLLVAAAAAGLAATLPALTIGRGALQLEPLPAADVGLGFSELAASPAAIQRYGLVTLSGITLMLAVATAVVCILTLLTLAVARSSARRSEFAVRRAVGASGRQLALGAVAEGGVMVLAAVALGGTAGLIAIRVALAAWPGSTAAPALLAPVLAVLAVSAVLLLGATLPTLSAGRMYAPAAPSAVPPSLTVAGLQLAISFAVLLAAAQIGRQARVLVAGAGGEAHGGGQILQLNTTGTPAERARRLAELIRRSGLAGVLEIASVTSPGALEGLGTVDVAITDCGRCWQGGIATPQRAVPVAFSVVSPDTFRAMNVHVVEGRSIAESDDWSARHAIVVSRALAMAHFENGDAVGRRIQVGQGSNNSFEVVGIVEDTKPVALGGALQPPYAVYASVLQFPASSVDLLVRPRAGYAIPEQWLRAALARVGTVTRVMAEEKWWADKAAPLRWFASALWIGGALTLVMAIFGTGAATHLWVAALMPELAMRRAVGARRRDVMIHVLSRAAIVAVGGVALGLVLNDLTSGPLAALVSGVPDIDLATDSRLALVLVTAALVGALLPAWRASRRNPAALAALLAE